MWPQCFSLCIVISLSCLYCIVNYWVSTLYRLLPFVYAFLLVKLIIITSIFILNRIVVFECVVAMVNVDILFTDCSGGKHC